MKKFSLTLIIIFMFSTTAGAKQINIAVADFVDKAAAFIDTSQATDIFINILSGASNIVQAKKSKSINTITAENAADSGKLAGCQYVILGTVMQVDMKDTYHYNNFLKLSVKDIAKEYVTDIAARVIDVATGKVILYVSGTGRANSSYIPQKMNTKEMTEKYRDMQNAAFSSAASIAAEKICAVLAGEYPEVSPVKSKTAGKKKAKKSPDNVRINRGYSSGVNNGTLYNIYFEGKEVFDLNGNSLGREKFNLAIAEVKETHENYSIAEIRAGNFNNIREGDRAEQITREETQLILENNDFSEYRFQEFMK